MQPHVATSESPSAQSTTVSNASGLMDEVSPLVQKLLDQLST